MDGALRLDYALEEIEDARESAARLNFATELIRVPFHVGKAFTYLHRCNELVEERVLSNKNYGQCICARLKCVRVEKRIKEMRVQSENNIVTEINYAYVDLNDKNCVSRCYRAFWKNTHEIYMKNKSIDVEFIKFQMYIGIFE